MATPDKTCIAPQPWRSEAADLGQFGNPMAAQEEAATKEREGEEETRLAATERRLLELFQQSFP